MKESITKHFFREIRDELNRYPNWPSYRPIELGQIGYLRGRQCTFDWHKTLTDLGISVATVSTPCAGDEFYGTEDAVDLRFFADSAIGSKAHFDFSRKRSLAVQGHDMSLETLDLADLERKLSNYVATNKGSWDRNWLIVTELWVGTAFTTLISGGSKSSIGISATIPPPPPGSPFNVANPEFGLRISSQTGMSYKSIAECRTGYRVHPYFHVHKLVEYPGKGLRVRRYAEAGFLRRQWRYLRRLLRML